MLSNSAEARGFRGKTAGDVLCRLISLLMLFHLDSFMDRLPNFLSPRKSNLKPQGELDSVALFILISRRAWGSRLKPCPGWPPTYVTRESWASWTCCTPGTVFLQDPRGPLCKQRHLRTLQNRLFPAGNQLPSQGRCLKSQEKTGLNTLTSCTGPSPQGSKPKCDLQTNISLLLKGVYLQFLSTRN